MGPRWFRNSRGVIKGRSIKPCATAFNGYTSPWDVKEVQKAKRIDGPSRNTMSLIYVFLPELEASMCSKTPERSPTMVQSLASSKAESLLVDSSLQITSVSASTLSHGFEVYEVNYLLRITDSPLSVQHETCARSLAIHTAGCRL